MVTSGGIEGYKKSGGDLGAAALGSGLGALGGGGLRMAGSALAGQALLANPVYRAVADKAARGAALTMPEMQMFKLATQGTGKLAAGAGALGLPIAGALAGNIAGGVAGGANAAAQRAGQLGAGVIGYTADGAPVYGGSALPPGLGQYGATSPRGCRLTYIWRNGRRLETLKTAQTQRDVLRTLLPEIEAAAEARSKKSSTPNGCRWYSPEHQDPCCDARACSTAGLEAGLGALPSRWCSDQPIPISVI